ncbi:hypothetical protein KA977_14725, partial [Candidatus Dependentiae bacterium]|nr:hypothetical protein [Candidatus Dependentiae bacterium]
FIFFSFFIYYISVFYLNDISFIELLNKFKNRGALSIGTIPLNEYVIHEIFRSLTLFGIYPILLIIFSILLFIKYGFRRIMNSNKTQFILIITFFSLMYHIGTYKTAFYHEYWTIHYAVLFSFAGIQLLYLVKNNKIVIFFVMIFVLSSCFVYYNKFKRVHGYNSYYTLSSFASESLVEDEVLLTNENLPSYYCAFIIKKNYISGLADYEKIQSAVKILKKYKLKIIIRDLKENTELIEKLKSCYVDFKKDGGFYLFSLLPGVV